MKDFDKRETPKEKRAREARAAKQIQTIGYASLRNRKSPQEIVQAMQMANGVTWAACKLLDCTMLEFTALISSDKQLGMMWRDMKKTLVARAESTMASLMDSQSELMRYNSAKYILDKLGTSEGYGQQSQIAVSVEQSAEDKALQIKAIFGINE